MTEEEKLRLYDMHPLVRAFDGNPFAEPVPKTELDFQRVSLPDLYCESVRVDGNVYGLVIQPDDGDTEKKRFCARFWINGVEFAALHTCVGKESTRKMACKALLGIIGRRCRKRRQLKRRKAAAKDAFEPRR